MSSRREPRGYAPPRARVGDVLPEAPGPLPDWVAVLLGVAVEYFLAVYVANGFATWIAEGVAGEDEVDATFSLGLDLVFTCGAELCAFWMALHLCRSRSFWIPTLTAALCWLIMFGERWLMEDYGFALWYEIGLLLTVPLALATLYVRTRTEPVTGG
jgi:hypothetical protein